VFFQRFKIKIKGVENLKTKSKLLLLALSLSLVAMALPQAFAHSHIETGTDQTVLLPDAYHGEEARGHAAFGIGVAKGGECHPIFGCPHFPEGLDAYPTQSADSAIIGGGGGDPINVK
jgi:hypothetical protein